MKTSHLICAATVILFSSYTKAGTTVIGGSSGTKPPLVSNNASWQITSTYDRAFPFTVASGGPYRVEAIEVVAFALQFSGDTSTTFTINTDDTGKPGESIAFFDIDIPVVDLPPTPQFMTIPATEETILESGSRYWIVGITGAAAVDWSLDNTSSGITAYRLKDDQWSLLSNRTSLGAFVIFGSPVPEPCTLLLLGLGAAMVRLRSPQVVRKRKS